MPLNGKGALVAGGSGGIGAASALLFVEAGAAVVITHRPGKEAAGAAVLACATHLTFSTGQTVVDGGRSL